MKATLHYEREQLKGPCAIWCAVWIDDKVIAGGYGETRDAARDRAINNAKVRLQNPIESEEVEL